jgi:hypothetical protein
MDTLKACPQDDIADLVADWVLQRFVFRFPHQQQCGDAEDGYHDLAPPSLITESSRCRPNSTSSTGRPSPGSLCQGPDLA